MNEPLSGGSQGAVPDTHDPQIQASLKRYWRANITLMAVLLACWAAVGLGCGILFADRLNHYTLPGTGFPLGFWFAQQGSIIGFVLIILIYALAMNHLDKKHHDELTRLREGGASETPAKARGAMTGLEDGDTSGNSSGDHSGGRK